MISNFYEMISNILGVEFSSLDLQLINSLSVFFGTLLFVFLIWRFITWLV